MFFAFSCNNFQLLETKKAAPEKWKTAKKIDLISYLNDIAELYNDNTIIFSIVMEHNMSYNAQNKLCRKDDYYVSCCNDLVKHFCNTSV